MSEIKSKHYKNNKKKPEDTTGTKNKILAGNSSKYKRYKLKKKGTNSTIETMVLNINSLCKPIKI